MNIQAPLSTLKRVNGIHGIPTTFTAYQKGLSADGNLVVHGVRPGDVILSATDINNAANLTSKFTSPATVANAIAQSDSNADHSTAVVLFVIQRG